ncbi:synapse differentiation-inducing gene protein 1-like [Sinocyclocheilus rhinocerous]|uniref:synapse differentiation-inducing gene protein 1-like n=1 Tax=Sinocyclocheilus rhinocerous TaxID=307959 RepID=UPI0007B80BC6|nr:PREDICTED: synapse differentiation-inducing gene protein 1-like [Sinocyclocheilus rhinocerous]
MDPSQSFNQPPGASNSSEKSGLPAAAPPAYQHNPAGYPPSFPNQPVTQGPYTQGPYPGQAVVTVQPAVFVTAAPLANPVPDYLGYSIFTMLCCCLPLGIAALIYSISTRDANFSGQRELAEKNSKTALILNHIGLGIGLVVIVLMIIIQIVILSAR